MALPHLALLPPSTIRLSIAPQEWEACLEAWITLAEANLRLPARQFSSVAHDNGSLAMFIPPFYRELVSSASGDDTLHRPKARGLQKVCFMLFDRMVADEVVPNSLLSLAFLDDFCLAHIRSTALCRLMHSLWKRKTGVLEPTLQKRKEHITSTLESAGPAAAIADLTLLAPVLRASADIGAFFITGSDFLDALTSSYPKLLSPEQQKALTTTVYTCLTSLVKLEHANISALSDSLYALKRQTDGQVGTPTLLSDLVTNTPLLTKLRRSVNEKVAGRLLKLLDTLETYRMPSIARPWRHPRRSNNKAKAKAKHADREMHVHRESLVTQIQELFPDLGSVFILILLDEYDENVELVTAHLLEGSLPPHLQALDRAEQGPPFDTDPQEKVEHLAPRSTPPPPEPFVPDRHNVFDDDDLLAADASRLHIGKRTQRTESGPANKAAILAALAAFDADDDERDDTYDGDDVGGTIDTAHPDGEPGPAAKVTQEENDAALFTTYKSAPELFGRTFDIRRGQARMALKAETGMKDEAIEGWAIMLQRDPRRLKKMQDQAGSFDGRQTELAGTAYRDGTETEDSDAPGAGGRGGGYRGRGGFGRGSGRGRGRGGSVAGPSGEQGTAEAQRRKEASKGSRANHNRRDQRARKMARDSYCADLPPER
ncbi:hypothetical protein LTR91_025769 [Friedmanniomyces endolithicus]|uniref:CUE domain-containing protein n=1 Tax=Friedmanniomyces endolithicus TaxID=329885 RepID=A0AAN6H289_9PEZI|nr:hypothetical protein LTR57_018145 [Friedmanniomyces endolithicus]KAK0950300.1 hypothetical protein LTR91_025769 [Friedmanniomyces endolithicus]